MVFESSSQLAHKKLDTISLLFRQKCIFYPPPLGYEFGGRRNRGVNLPPPYFLSQFLLLPKRLPHIFCLLPMFSPYFSLHLFLGHFSLLPILFLPPLLTSEIFTRYPSSNFFAFMLQAAPICRESTSRFPFSEALSLHCFQLAACKFNNSVFSQLIQYHLSASSSFCSPLSLICLRIAMKLNCECDVVILQIVVPR